MLNGPFMFRGILAAAAEDKADYYFDVLLVGTIEVSGWKLLS